MAKAKTIYRPRTLENRRFLKEKGFLEGKGVSRVLLDFLFTETPNG